MFHIDVSWIIFLYPTSITTKQEVIW